MANDNEMQRLAAMANQLRPDWPVMSLITHLVNNHAHRTYRDLAVALAWIATDPTTQNPARLTQAGPWWDATNPTKASHPIVKAHRCHGHPSQPASHCQDCIDQAVPKPAWFPSFKWDLFTLPPDVAALAPETRPEASTPAETCGMCHENDCDPGRGICPGCSATVSAS